MNDPDMLEEALQAVLSMSERGKVAQAKFAQGTAQHTLQKNRIGALNVAALLILREQGKSDQICGLKRQDLEKAAAPLNSLLSKSEKALTKLSPGKWQHTMLGKNIKALHFASQLLIQEISAETPQAGSSTE